MRVGSAKYAAYVEAQRETARHLLWSMDLSTATTT